MKNKQLEGKNEEKTNLKKSVTTVDFSKKLVIIDLRLFCMIFKTIDKSYRPTVI